MIRPVLIAVLAAVIAPGLADARSRPPHHNWHDEWENRRDARRAGVIAGVLTAGIASAAGKSDAERRYEECLYATGYDYECERRRFYDEQNARRAARRSGALAGVIVRGIVRD